MSTLAVTLEGIAPATLTIELGTPGPAGSQGPQGIQGIQGIQGVPGVGVPAGGLTGEYLVKTSNTDFITGWSALSLNYLPLAGGAMDVDATISFEDTVLDRVSEVAGFGFSVSSASNINLKSNVLFDRVSVANVTSATSIIPTGVEFPDLTLQTSAGISAATAASTYLPLTGGSLYGQLLLPSSTTSAASLRINIGVAPTTPVSGDLWYTGTNFQFGSGSGTTGTIPALSTNNSFTGQNTFGGATNIFGVSASASTTSVATGLTTSGVTKALNLGTGGLAGSITNILVGSTTGTSTTTLRGTTNGVTAAADTNSVALATTAYVVGQASSTTPAATGTAAVGTSLKYARADHVHANPLPPSGTAGQVLSKVNGTSYNVQWETFIPGDRYLTTSSTSNAVSNGNKTFTVGTGLSYTTQQDVTIAYDAAHHMHGLVLTYNSGTGVMTVDIQNHTGTGTYTAWTVNVGGTVPLASVAWGDITGTLGSQTDLATALNNKLEVSTAASTYTTFGYTASTYFLLAGGALNLNTNITASNTSDSDSEMAGFGFGVQKSSDHTKGTTVEFDGLDTYDGASHMNVNPTGLVFPDATTQTTSATNLGYISQGTADGLYYSISNPNGFTSNYFDATAAIQAVSNNYASSVGNYPSNGNYLKYNGMSLEWDTPGGGGYITSVTAPLSVSAGDLSVDLSDYYLNSNPNGFTNYQDSNAISAISGGATSSISGSPSSGNVLGYNGSQITWVSNGSPYSNSVWAYGNWYTANVTGIYDGYMNYYTVLTF